MIQLILAFFLGATGLFVIVGLSRLLLEGVNFDLVGYWQRWQLHQYFARLERSDLALASGDVGSALHELEAALVPSLVSTRETAETILRHHVGLLSRLIAAADHVQGGTVRLLSLAKVDRLFQERRLLQRRFVDLHTPAGRAQLDTIREEHRTNTVELRTALQQLTAEIIASQPTNRMH